MASKGKMKICMIAFNRSMNEFILDIFKHDEISGYTLWKDVIGEGDSEPKHGTHIWPAMNNVVLVAVDEKHLERIKKDFEKVRQQHPEEGMRMFVMPLEEVV